MISTPLVLYFVGALVVSFCCSLFEAVILSISPARIEQLVREGRPSGVILRRLKQRIDHPLISILTLNTVANMFGAAGVGNEAGHLAQAAGRSDDEAIIVTIASAILTLAILVLSEIVPKTLGATYWRTLARPVALPLQALVLILTPIVRMLEFIPRLITRGKTDHHVTREDLAATAEMVRAGGDTSPRESALITNVLKLRAARAKDVLTPRVEMFTLQQDQTVDEVVHGEQRLRFARMPVYAEADEFVGMVLRSAIFEAAVRGKESTRMHDLLRPVRYVPETMPLTRLLDEFLTRDEHLVLVVDEYGSVEGLITLEDVLETLLGEEIIDELDTVADMQAVARMRAEARRRRLAERTDD
ncbi:MAG: HlyC/CorC family transporter [Phycisphaerales bacterium]|nr:HlyC/CorC family transporter [Phycisphaerales bacterium]